jgi:hypothetical protein
MSTDLVLVCVGHNHVMPCHREGCREATIKNKEAKHVSRNILETKRKDLLDKYEIKDEALNLLIADLCSKDIITPYNYQLIRKAINGEYSDLDSGDAMCQLTLIDDLITAGYADLTAKVRNGSYDHPYKATPKQ